MASPKELVWSYHIGWENYAYLHTCWKVHEGVYFDMELNDPENVLCPVHYMLFLVVTESQISCQWFGSSMPWARHCSMVKVDFGGLISLGMVLPGHGLIIFTNMLAEFIVYSSCWGGRPGDVRPCACWNNWDGVHGTFCKSPTVTLTPSVP